MSRSLSAVFCDDIRQEVTGKMIYVGVYHNAMIAHEFPLTLPNFYIMATVVTPVKTPFTKLAIRVLLKQTVIQELVVTDELLKPPPGWLTESIDPNGERLFLARGLFAIAPLTVHEPCFLRVIAETEAEELRCPALAILPTPDQEKALPA